jgi:beta-lactam-binding protein with PASTA domain
MRVKSPIAVFALVAALAGCGGDDEPQAVPDVRGERLDVAEERLDDAGLGYEEIGGGTFGIVVRSRWHVCDQEPRPGRRATEVRLIVARHCPPPPPPPQPVVPDVVGDTVEEAEDALEAKEIGYALERWYEPEPIVRSTWLVCEQSPEGGERGGHVRLVVASRCDPARAAPVVPDVIGEDLDDAEGLLAAEGLVVETIPPVLDQAAKRLWEVCDQEPAGGERARRVALYVERSCAP